MKAQFHEGVHVVAVEGGIGVGKSTALDILSDGIGRDPRVRILPEPCAEWREPTPDGGPSMLEGLYGGTLSALAFQGLALAMLGQPLLAAAWDPEVAVVIIERSPLSNYKVFAKQCLQTKEEMHYFLHAYAKFTGSMPDHRRVTILLDASAEVLGERTLKRGRPEEEGIPLSLHENLNKRHAQMYEEIVELCDQTNRTGQGEHRACYRLDAAELTPRQVACAIENVAGACLANKELPSVCDPRIYKKDPQWVTPVVGMMDNERTAPRTRASERRRKGAVDGTTEDEGVAAQGPAEDNFARAAQQFFGWAGRSPGGEATEAPPPPESDQEVSGDNETRPGRGMERGSPSEPNTKIVALLR